MHFLGRYAVHLLGHVPKKVGWDTGVDRFSSIKPFSRIFLENLVARLAGQKNSTKASNVNPLQRKKNSATFD
jgi:hypothetical protein